LRVRSSESAAVWDVERAHIGRHCVRTNVRIGRQSINQLINQCDVLGDQGTHVGGRCTVLGLQCAHVGGQCAIVGGELGVTLLMMMMMIIKINSRWTVAAKSTDVVEYDVSGAVDGHAHTHRHCPWQRPARQQLIQLCTMATLLLLSSRR
jgi:hypothetical protein